MGSRCTVVVCLAISALGCSVIYPFEFDGDPDAGPASDGSLDGAPDGGADAGVDGGTCESLDDPDDCGACGNACTSEQVCVARRCRDDVRVEAGALHACAVTGDGEVYCWGDNGIRQVGTSEDPDTASARRMQFAAGVELDLLAVGDYHACAISRDRAVWCWGAGSEGEAGTGTSTFAERPVQIPDMSNASLLTCGGTQCCAVASVSDSPGLWCWGRNDFGQLGSGVPEANIFAPTQVVLLDASEVVSLHAGDAHTCARVQADATGPVQLYCWGRNNDGELGQGDFLDRATPAAVALPGSVLSAALGHETSCAIVSAGAAEGGALYCWGRGDEGQLGQNGSTDSDTPLPVRQMADGSDYPEPWYEVSVGRSHTCARRDTPGDSSSREMFCWGLTTFGVAEPGGEGTGVSTQRLPNQLATPSDVTRVAAGDTFSCGVRDRRLVCWGSNLRGEAGEGTPILRPRPTRVRDDATQVGLGNEFSCVRTLSGEVQCAGNPLAGALGDGTIVPRSTFAPVTLPAPVEQLETYTLHACALSGGEVRCWGEDSFGRLGHAGDGLLPGLVTFDPADVVRRVAPGRRATCAHVERGGRAGVRCWGLNTRGELAIGTTVGELGTPQAFVNLGDTVRALDGGDGFFCAVAEEMGARTIQCWGDGGNGRLGQGAGGIEPVPVVVPGVDGLVLGAGGTRACVADGTTLHCWGSNTFGELGPGLATLFSPASTNVDASVAQIAIGRSHMCVRDDAGAVQCRGRNQRGQLGAGMGPDRDAFLPVELERPATQIAAVDDSTCAVLADDSLWCWGHDLSGKLGLGRPVALSAPTPVRYLAEP